MLDERINLIENSSHSFHSIVVLHRCMYNLADISYIADIYTNGCLIAIYMHLSIVFTFYEIVTTNERERDTHNQVSRVLNKLLFFLTKSLIYGCTILKRHKINNTDMSELYVMDFMLLSLQRTRRMEKQKK